MLHMKDDKYAPVDAPAGATAVDVSPRDFEDVDVARTGLSPRRDRQPAAGTRRQHPQPPQPHKRPPTGAPEIDLNPYHDAEDDDAFGDDGELFDSEGKPRALQHDSATSSDGLTDARFRVNGIAVGREIQGGPKPGWEHAYQILFQNSTPTGQRVALILLIMVSLSIACGACVPSAERVCVCVFCVDELTSDRRVLTYAAVLDSVKSIRWVYVWTVS